MPSPDAGQQYAHGRRTRAAAGNNQRASTATRYAIAGMLLLSALVVVVLLVPVATPTRVVLVVTLLVLLLSLNGAIAVTWRRAKARVRPALRAFASSSTFWGFYTAATYLVDVARGRGDPGTTAIFGAGAAVLFGPLLYLSLKTREDPS